MDNFNKEITNCVSCATLNEEWAEYCENCGLPLGASATLDPVKTIQSEGFLLHKAVTKRPKFVVLLGIWILFLPWLIGAVPVMFREIADGKEFADFVFFCISCALALVAIRILFLVTRNYLTMPDLRHNPNIGQSRREKLIRLKVSENK